MPLNRVHLVGTDVATLWPGSFMKASLSFITVCQQALCLLADFDASRLQIASALYRRGLLRASPERRPFRRAEVEARRAHCSRFVNNAG
jgi:hypothetical protein